MRRIGLDWRPKGEYVKIVMTEQGNIQSYLI